MEGHTLAERIGTQTARAAGSRGLRVKDALSLALQIAMALEAAHERGIVHRDLKPANIKITPEGTAKILDFGVARAMLENDEPSEVTRVDAVTDIGTRDGAVIGTAPYMSPEQARGEAVDRRTDVWAFGCVLYEMLTGSRAFKGPDTAATVSQIFEREPDLAALPVQTPASVRRLLGLCLEKDRHRRLAQIAVARFQLEDAIASLARVGQTKVRARRRLHSMLALGMMSAALVPIAWFSLSGPASIPAAVTYSLLSVTPAEHLGGPEGRPSRTAIAISRDGRTVLSSAAVAGTRALYLRPLNQARAVKLQDTDGADTPFFSPDGRWVGYWANGELRKVPASGGPAVRVAQTSPIFDGQGNLVPGTWTPDGRQLLYYSVASNLPRATWVYDIATKHPATTLVRSAGSTTAGGVDVSRDGRWIAYHSNESGDFQVYVQAYPTGVPRVQISTDGGISPVWRADGKELFYVEPNAGWNRSTGNVRIMAVSIGSQPGLSADAPKALFSGEYAMNAPARAWDVTPDGQRFLLIRADETSQAGIGQVNLVQNWTEELKRLVPVPELPAGK